MEKSADVAVIGGGIVGLAHAYMALRKGLSVVLFERDRFSTGASVRNFGLLWPIGQEAGTNLGYALRSREHWSDVAHEANLWMNANGSLHLAYYSDEQRVLEEFLELYKTAPYQSKLLTPVEVARISPATSTSGLKAALWSKTEATVNPREAIHSIPLWLKEKFGLHLRYGNMVRSVTMPWVKTSDEQWRVQKVFVCPGADFDSLFPEIYLQHPITKCKLQMMKGVTDSSLTLGPTLCAGLTLRHYANFSKCPSLAAVDERYNQDAPEYARNGIHVLLAQNNYGEFIIGDSHEYARTLEPFDKTEVNEQILQYLTTFTQLRNLRITERWHGIYPKMTGSNFLIHRPEKDVVLVNGLGGAGMTLSFGLAEELTEQEL